MENAFFFNWEVTLIELLQQLNNGLLTAIASLISELGDQYAIVAIIGFLYWGSQKKWGKYVFLCLGPVQAIAPMLKDIVCRPRPYMVHESIKCLKAVHAEYDIMDIAAQGYSFPSMHSASSAAVYGSLCTYACKNGRKLSVYLTIGLLIPLFVGISRFYLGVHYPTDVLAGWAVGFILISVVGFFYVKTNNVKWIYLGVMLAAFPGIFFCTGNDYYTSYGLIAGGYLAFMFEEKYVNFESSDKILITIIRVICGAGLFVGLNAVLKLPFSEAFLDGGTKLSLMVRLIRYGIVSFSVMGLYPMTFKLFRKKANI